MKFTTIILFILMVGGIFLSVTLISIDLNTYSEVLGTQKIDTSLWEEKYDYAESINRSIDPLLEKFDDIQDEDKGWFSKLGSGIVAIPYALVAFASLVIGSIGTMNNIMVEGLKQLKFPPEIIYIFLVFMGVWGISKLLQFFNKTDSS